MGFFRTRKILDDWLLDNCQYFIGKYPGSKNKTNRRVKKDQNSSIVAPYLDRLTFLKLLDSKSALASNNEETTEYRFTDLGKLVALILKFDYNPNDLSLIDKIFNQTLIYYSSQNYSHSKFCRLFFTNCYHEDKYYFEIIILKLLHILREPPNDKNSVNSKLRNFPIFYRHINLFKVLIKSINEFKLKFPIDYEKVAYRLKLAIESIQGQKSKNLLGFEVLRSLTYYKLNSVVLEGYCITCKYFTPVLVNIYEYLHSYVLDPSKESRSECPRCHSQNGLNFEMLIEPVYPTNSYEIL
jgi:hypothetical protein